MTFANYELSDHNGQPVELYHFQRGLQAWRYTSAESDFVVSGVPYESTQVARSNISQLNDISGVTLSLTFARDHEFASEYLGFTPELVTTVTIYRVHRGDTDVELSTYWKGRVISGVASDNELTLECESVFTSMRRVGLRAKFLLNCRHALYSQSCGVNMDLFKVSGPIQGATNTVISMAAAGLLPNDWFTGGILRLQSGAARFIVKHNGSTLTINRPFLESTVGLNVDIFPGCDHLRSTCSIKFNNVLNYGGFPYIPGVNPFSGKSIL